jgi:hypothetical protein
MAVFPAISSIPADNPLTERINFKNTQVGFGKESQERIKRQWDYPKRDITLKYTWIPLAEALTLWNFYLARGGSFEAFKYIHPFYSRYENEFVDIAPGNLEYFLLPSVDASNYTLYSDGTPLNEGSDYFFYSEGSPEGIDYIEVFPPGQGAVLTWTFTGRLVTRCKFDEDSQDFETFHNRLSKMGIKLKGLLYSEQFGFATVVSPFFFDEFDDESLDSHWTKAGSVTEGADGKVLISDPGAGVARLSQDDIVLGTTFFDVYTKFDTFTKAGGADAWYTMEIQWGGNYPRAEIGLRWDNGNSLWKVWFTTVNSSNQTSLTQYTLGASLPEKLWVRLSYQFGDSYVRGWWTTSQPVGDEGWTEITTSPYHCDPQSGIADLNFEAISTNAASFKVNYFRDTFDTPGPATTTSTTTTTT